MANSQAPIPNIYSSRWRSHVPRSSQCVGKFRKSKARSSGFTVCEVLKLAARLFKQIGIDSSRLDAEVLLAHVLGKSSLQIFLERSEPIAIETVRDFFQLVSRRLSFEPVAYLIGRKEFFGLDFLVSNDCLIPRPDTEVVVETCLSLLDKYSADLVIDLCTGSGAIAISILKERPSIRMIASDISLAALAIAKINAGIHAVNHRLTLRAGDLFEPILTNEKAGLIVSNPPYIAQKDLALLPSSVRNYEPRLALDGGDDLGLSFYESILREAPNFLRSKGFLVLEIGYDQADKIKGLIGQEWQFLKVVKDLGSHDRCIVLQLREHNKELL